MARTGKVGSGGTGPMRNGKQVKKTLASVMSRFRSSDDDLRAEAEHGIPEHTITMENLSEKKGDDRDKAIRSEAGEEKKVDPVVALVEEQNDDGVLTPKMFHFVPLQMGGDSGRTHMPSRESASLIDEIGGLPMLERMTNHFYEKAFRDDTLDKFIHSHDDPHGRRFATWIHQKLGGPGRVWDDDRASRSRVPHPVAGGHRIVVQDRTSAHVAAWYSTKRPPRDVGRHFQLDECRVWMRLHFWAMRESGIVDLSPSFADYYVRFIGHFVRVYESKAPIFTRDAFRWSADPSNLRRYQNENGWVMTDVLGLPFHEALKQIPSTEARDVNWPYIQSLEETSEENGDW